MDRILCKRSPVPSQACCLRGPCSKVSIVEQMPNGADSMMVQLTVDITGVGVGDASASPTAAILLSILQDSTGRLATIMFAHRLGTSLEPECKMYRLAADVFNDTAMILDCLSPVFPKGIRVLVLSTGGVLRALCGVAAGSAKASLSAHFAKWGNLGELNAKDSSQETIISLLGMLVRSSHFQRRTCSTLIVCVGRELCRIECDIAIGNMELAFDSANHPSTDKLSCRTRSTHDDIEQAASYNSVLPLG